MSELDQKKRLVPWVPDWVGAGLVAGCLWGIWAAVANFEHGYTAALSALITQGMISFTMAGTLTLFVQFLVGAMSDLVAPVRLVVVTLIAAAVLFLIQYTMHSLANTPNVLLTIIPAVCAGSTWCFIYANRIIKTSKLGSNT